MCNKQKNRQTATQKRNVKWMLVDDFVKGFREDSLP